MPTLSVSSGLSLHGQRLPALYGQHDRLCHHWGRRPEPTHRIYRADLPGPCRLPGSGGLYLGNPGYPPGFFLLAFDSLCRPCGGPGRINYRHSFPSRQRTLSLHRHPRSPVYFRIHLHPVGIHDQGNHRHSHPSPNHLWFRIQD